MCYYDQYKMGCGCFKWGHFRQHCTREYRTGEICGMRLVMATYMMEEEKCKLCTRLATKWGRVQKEKDRIKRWKKESGRKASIEASEEIIQNLEMEMNDLEMSRQSCRLGFAPSIEASRKITRSHRDLTTVANHDKAGHRQFQRPAMSEEPLAGLLVEALVGEAKTRPNTRREESLSNAITPEPKLSNASQESLRRQVPKTNSEFGCKSKSSTIRISHKESGGVRSGLEPKALADTHYSDMVDYSSESCSVELPVEAVRMVEGSPHADDTHWEQAVDIVWKCSCGTTFQEQVIEYKPDAAQKLAESVDAGHSIDIERQAGSKSCSESSASDSSSSSLSGSYQRTSKGRNNVGAAEIVTKEYESPGDRSARGTHKEFILLCRDNGIETRLHHADVSETQCDYSSYHVMHAQYYGRLRGFWKWMTLREILSIEFVKFHLYWKTNVSIERKDFGELPPYPSENYSYTADTNPPVLRTALRHFIEHPSHAPKHPHHRPRIPKKVGGPLLLCKSLDAREGYGLYIQERVCWRKVFVIEAVFATACMIFAIVWCIKNSGGIQDGFAIAGTGIAYATIILGASQAVAQTHWK